MLEGNETFDILITPSAEDEEVLSITDPVITVTIQEDSVDCKSVFKSECTYILTIAGLTLVSAMHTNFINSLAMKKEFIPVTNLYYSNNYYFK